MFSAVARIFRTPDLRKKIGFTLGIIAIFRLGSFLPAPFVAPAGERIGEIWFEPPPELPELLVKYIFTSEALSVQVHPSDLQTLAAGLGRQGKEECWLVIAAEPGALSRHV